MPHDDFAKGWEGWIRRHVQRELDKLKEEIADAVVKNIIRERKQTDARIAELEERAAKSDTATLELVGALERKIVDLERRAMLKPTRPHLVAGDPDAA